MNRQEIFNSLNIRDFYSFEISSIRWNSKDEGIGLCPFHRDNKESLSVNQNTGLFFCHACKEKGDIFSFYQKKHGVNFKTALSELAKQAGISEDKKEISKTYDYLDESGSLLFQTVRCKPKDFRQRRQDGKGGWVWNLKGVRLIPYNLPELIKSEDVFIVEGEKDCENLKNLGFVATTNPMGAQKWKSEYNEYFKDKKVYILADNDKAGKDHTLTVAKNLKGTAQSVKVVELPNLKEKEDISDWLSQGGTKEELIEIIKQTPEWRETEKPDLLSSLLKWNDILNLDVRTEYLLQNLIPKGAITLLFGTGGVGKTSLALQIGRAVAEGTRFGNLETIQTPVYFIDFENPLSALKERAERIGPCDNFYVWHISNPTPPPRLDSHLWELYQQLPPGLLIVDTLRASHLLDENNSRDMAVVIAKLKEIREKGFTILLLHHTPKGNECIYKGSTALLDLADHCLGLERITRDETVEFDEGNTYRLGVRMKTRYEPHHIFLAFDTNLKGFKVTEDPDYEKIEAILEILKESPKPLKQTDIKSLAKAELDLTEFEVRRLLKKGTGQYWETEKGDRNATFYIPHNFSLSVCRHIYSQQTNKLESAQTNELTNRDLLDSTEYIENTEFDSLLETLKQTEKLDRCGYCVKVGTCIMSEGQRQLCGGPFEKW